MICPKCHGERHGGLIPQCPNCTPDEELKPVPSSRTPRTDSATFDSFLKNGKMRRGCVVNAELAKDLETELQNLKYEFARVKFQRDALLEMTWLDLPGNGAEEECTTEWREQFEAGWERRAGAENNGEIPT